MTFEETIFKKNNVCLFFYSQYPFINNVYRHEMIFGDVHDFFLIQADDDCRTKDKELSELLERMSQYEGVSKSILKENEKKQNLNVFMINWRLSCKGFIFLTI